MRTRTKRKGPEIDGEILLSAKGAAAVLGVSYAAVCRYVRVGGLPAIKLHGLWFRRADVAKWLLENRRRNG